MCGFVDIYGWIYLLFSPALHRYMWVSGKVWVDGWVNVSVGVYAVCVCGGGYTCGHVGVCL